MERAPPPGLPDRRDPDLRCPAGVRPGGGARRHDGRVDRPTSPARYDEGRPLPAHAPRMLEENLWRAIRWGMDGELIDLAPAARSPRGRGIDELLEAVAEVAARAGHHAVPGPARGADAWPSATAPRWMPARPARAVAGGGGAHARLGRRVAGSARGRWDERRRAAARRMRLPRADGASSRRVTSSLITSAFERTGLAGEAASRPIWRRPSRRSRRCGR